MGKALSEINERARQFIEDAPVFFVATAPAGDEGHVNISPKGLDSFRILSPNRVAYADLTGSGAETIAHIRENGRVTFMFTAFSGKPNILRLYGKGSVFLPGTEEFDELLPNFKNLPGLRAIIAADVDRVSNSCGFGVPLMELVGEREELIDWANNKGEDGVAKYWVSKNSISIDGLPAIDPPEGSTPDN